MSLQEGSISGLKRALSRLPTVRLRRAALRALDRLIFDDDFGEREPPVHVRVATRHGRSLKATLFTMHGGGFSFVLFMVRCSGGGSDLVVARAYERYPSYAATSAQ
jgi:hypothetical protein